jgi:hypothetical protein
VASGNATINFKRMGRKAKVLNQFSPFFNATLQASVREAEQVATLKGFKTGDPKAIKGAVRYLTYLASMGSLGFLYWLLRSDDDDWRNQDSYMKERFWSWGSHGNTFLTLQKPRDAGGLASTFVEASLDRMYYADEGAKPALDSVKRHAKDRIPVVGSGLPAAILDVWSDWDSFRDRPLTPRELKGKAKQDQYTAYTLGASKVMGKITGPWLGLSPIHAEHIINQASGGAARRWGSTAEALATGTWGPENVPAVGGVIINRHQRGPVNDFYDRMHDLETRPDDQPLTAKEKMELAQLRDYRALMSTVSKAEPRDLRGRRSFDFDPYVVGLALEAMGRKPQESNPNPFEAEDLPEPVRAALESYATSQAKAVVLSHGMPAKEREGEEFAVTLANWETNQRASEVWMDRHRDTPIVQKALQEVKASKAYREILEQKGMPQWNGTQDKWADYTLDLKRWQRRYDQAVKWLHMVPDR